MTTAPLTTVVLRPRREARTRSGHPWVYASEIAELPDVSPAETVAFCQSDGKVLGHGYCNPASAIPGRLFAHGASPPEESWIEQRLRQAIDLRQRLFGERWREVSRVVSSEGDGIPGLILDRYDDVWVAQETTAGIEARREGWLNALDRVAAPVHLYLRNQLPVRRKEGLEIEAHWLRGGPGASFERIERTFELSGVEFRVDPTIGHKTGFYLDQRRNYERWRSLVRPGDTVLDLFCYQGGFAQIALAAGARRAIAVDSSEPALAWARGRAEANRLSGFEPVVDDVHRFLHADRNRYSMVSLDPPPLAKKKGQIKSAYNKSVQLHRLALEHIEPGGILFSFVCSEAIDWQMLRKILKSAATRAGRQVQIVERLVQSPDHPIPVDFPEAEYLRGFVAVVR